MDDRIYEEIKEKNMAKAERYLCDAEIKGRQHKNICKKCYYLRSFDFTKGSTSCNCQKCGKEMTFPDSDIDIICPACAKRHSICVKCGAKMD